MKRKEKRHERRLSEGGQSVKSAVLSFAAIDFETANSQRHSACALGVVTVDGNKVTERMWLIRPPGNRYSAVNTRIHGIAASDTRNAQPFSEVWPEAKLMIGTRPVVAHNMEFDGEVLSAALAYYDTPTPRLSKGCSLDMARLVWPDRKNYTLAGLCGDLGINLDHHNALSDARAVTELVKLIANIQRCDLPELLRRSKRGSGQRREKARLRAMESKPPTEKQLDYLESLLSDDKHPRRVISAVIQAMKSTDRAVVSQTIDGAKSGQLIRIGFQNKRQLKALTGKGRSSTSRGRNKGTTITFTVQ